MRLSGIWSCSARVTVGQHEARLSRGASPRRLATADQHAPDQQSAIFPPEYEQDVSLFELYHNGAEGYWSSGDLDWGRDFPTGGYCPAINVSWHTLPATMRPVWFAPC